MFKHQMNLMRGLLRGIPDDRVHKVKLKQRSTA